MSLPAGRRLKETWSPDGCSLKAYRFLVTGPGGSQSTQL